MYFLIKNPHVYAKLQSEIDTAIEGGSLQIPVSYTQGLKLDYCQACIKETLRLLPAVDCMWVATFCDSQ